MSIDGNTRQHQEYVYLDLLRKIINHGKKRDERTGVGTLSIFGEQMRFDISTTIPVLTTKFVPWKSCIRELLWFLDGQTDARMLQEQGVKIWDGNSSREYLDSRKLNHLPVGDIGAGYGHQWRHFGAPYITCKDSYSGQGFDQISFIIDELKNNPTSRRIFMSSWNANDLDKMALPPCHVSAQFYVDFDDDGNKHLSCQMYQRSVDMFLGCPWNIMSYAVLTCYLAKITDMQPKELIMCLGDTHIYCNHIEQVKEQLTRAPYPFPTLIISDVVKDKTIDELTLNDFALNGYTYHPAIKADMAV
jgi:thymidylate synthase